MANVHVVSKDWSATKLFIENGWSPVQYPGDADLLLFAGTEDVDPSLYGEPRLPITKSCPTKDSFESHFFHTWVDLLPMVGINRGARFLHVMNGGTVDQETKRLTYPWSNRKEGDAYYPETKCLCFTDDSETDLFDLIRRYFGL